MSNPLENRFPSIEEYAKTHTTPMIMVKKDSTTNQDTSVPVSVTEAFSNAKKYLEDLIKTIDNTLRTTVSGTYSITIDSDCLLSDRVKYKFTNKHSNSIIPVDNGITVEGVVKRDPITYESAQ